ncbi:class II aldolase/adducin family protein [Streptomyces sp. 3N207]|uniref:class II aldolase/adducin family protein n=1 Tax=Streptomyces sp. 3N207 TaxID=3457417 RepID=UPI003FCF2750
MTVDTGEGARTAAVLGSHKGVLLRNHGLLTVGDQVGAAARWRLRMELACRIQLAVRAAGKPVPTDQESAVATRSRPGGDIAAWHNYQPLYTRITPDECGLLS